MQTPLTFFLELLALALLALAAAGPALVRKEAARQLVVVLDDSYSMLARDPKGDRNSPRRQAEIELIGELARDNYVTRFLLAGPEPRQIGQSLRTADETKAVLAAWECQSPWADLRRALAAAAELGGRRARILVLTDQARHENRGGTSRVAGLRCETAEPGHYGRCPLPDGRGQRPADRSGQPGRHPRPRRAHA